MKIASYLHDYEICYTSEFAFLDELGAMSDSLVVVDKKVYDLYANVLSGAFGKSGVLTIEALEENKTIESALLICKAATEVNAKRNLAIISIGGGIVQDIAGFAASILYRGVSLILVPTTLLGLGDSCIGSKTSLNYLDNKNLLGTFYPPKKVYICPRFTKTLTELDFYSGLGEVIRFMIMDCLDNIPIIERDIDKFLSRDNNTIQSAILSAHAYKKKMVEQDEFDLNLRRIFNYGHTFGHAFEAISDYKIPHGLAVVLGMVTANKISVMRGILDNETSACIERLCKKLYIAEPFVVTNARRYMDFLKKDKKRQGTGIAAVLMKSGGEFDIVQDVRPDEVIAAVEHTQEFMRR